MLGGQKDHLLLAFALPVTDDNSYLKRPLSVFLLERDGVRKEVCTDIHCWHRLVESVMGYINANREWVQPLFEYNGM